MSIIDWNRNGKRDAFDLFMDMKVMEEIFEKEENDESDDDDYDEDEYE